MHRMMNKLEDVLPLHKPDEYSKGNVVFIESIPGPQNNKQTIDRMSDAMDLLGIPSYLIQLEDKVKESLSAITQQESSSRLRKKSNPRIRPRFTVLESLASFGSRSKSKIKSPELMRRPKMSSQTLSQKTLEVDAQFSVLRLHVQEICGVNPDGWVLLVETQMRRILDVLRLEKLAQTYNFKMHWLTTGSKKRCGLKFNEIVVEILKDKTERGRKKPSWTRSPFQSRIAQMSDDADMSSNIQVLHDSARTTSATSSYLATTASEDRSTTASESLTAPPFFPKGRRKADDSSHDLRPRDSVTTLLTTDSGGSVSSIFEVRSDENMVALSRLPAPDLDRLLEIGCRDSNNNIEEERPTFVVTVRDLFPGARSQLAKTLKNMLRRDGILAYVMSVSNMFTQGRAVNLMKRYAQEAGHDPNDVNRGCKILIINGLHYKLSEQKQRVIIVDLEDESVVRMFPIYDFCIRAGVKTLPLEKRPDGSFEQNLNRVYQSIKKGISGTHKTRKYKLPKLNAILLEQLKPVVVVSSNLMKMKPKSSFRKNAVSPTQIVAHFQQQPTNNNSPVCSCSKMKQYDENHNEFPGLHSNPTLDFNDNTAARSSHKLLAEQDTDGLFCTTQFEKFTMHEDSDEDEHEDTESDSESSDSDDFDDVDEKDEDEEVTTNPSQATVVRNPNRPDSAANCTDEEANFSSVYDFIPNDPIPGSASDSDVESIRFNQFEPKLIEIKRWQDRKPVRNLRDIRYLNHLPKNQAWDVDTSDEELFIGWVGRVKPKHPSRSPFVYRLLKGIRNGFRKYVLHPIGRIMRTRRFRSTVSIDSQNNHQTA